MITEVMSFLGYVFCFWILWRFFDLAVHYWWPVKPKINQDCISCVRLEGMLKNAETDLNYAHGQKERADRLESKLAAWRKFVPTLVDFMNKATAEELLAISNIGRVRVGKILSNRPYKTFNDVYKIGISRHDINAILKYYEKHYT